MSARNIVGGITGLAASAVKLPFTTAGKVLGHGKDAAAGAAATGSAAAGAVAKVAVEKTADRLEQTADKVEKTAEKVERSADKAAAEVKPAVKKAAAKKGSAEKPATKKPAAKKPAAKKPATNRPPAKKVGDRPVTAADLPLPPNLPLEPPVDIVEQTIASESEPHVGAGRVTQPKPATRDDGHGEAPLPHVEAEEISEEVAGALEEGVGGIQAKPSDPSKP